MEHMTEKIVQYLTECKYQDIPEAVVDTTKKFIMDTIGVGLAGATAPGCKEALQLFRGFGGKEEATLIGWGGKLPSPSAAFLNSLLFHALDFDDTYDPAAMHCYANTLPAALALAEAKGGITGEQFITAVAVGVDLCARLGLAIKTPLSWIRTATCGSFAAAATAAKVLGLDREGMHNALGVVYSQTAGNAQCLIDGGLTKRMQPAFSARAGTLSALMAQMGITGAREVFEGKYGFFNLYERGQYDGESMMEGLGKEYFGARLSIKPYPSCRMTHASIDAALYIKEKYGVCMKDVEKAELYTSKMCKNMVGSPFRIRTNPQVDAQFSIPYTVSVALEKGKPFIPDFNEDFVRMPKWRELSSRVLVFTDSSLDPRDLKSAAIKVYLKNGQILEHRVEVFKGNPGNPLNWDECVDKFKACAKHSLKEFKEAQLEMLLNKLINLEGLEDVREVTGLLG